jgi:VanZ family protein
MLQGQIRRLSYDGPYKHYLLALILCLASYLFFNLVTPYVSMGEQLLVNADFSQDSKGWKTWGNNPTLQAKEGTATLTHLVTGASSVISQCHERDALPDVVSAGIEARTQGLVLGEKSSHEARVGMVWRDFDGNINYRLSNAVVRLREDQSWRHYHATMLLPSRVEHICFRISLNGSQGVFQIRNPSLYQIQPTQSYRVGWWLFLLTWLGFGLWWLVLLGRYYWPRPQKNYLVAILLVAIGGILMSNEMKESLLIMIYSWLNNQPWLDVGILNSSLSQWIPTSSYHYWDLSKTAHLVVFFLLSCVVFSQRSVPTRWLLSGLVVMAICSEVVQYFSSGRTPRVKDLIVDTTGILLGLWLMRSYYWVRQYFSN